MGLKQRVWMLRASLQKILCCQIPFRYLATVRFPHPVGIVIGDGVRIGRDVRIYQNVTIGLTQNVVGAEEHQYPVIEDEVFIYAGAVIFGAITIGRGSVIGANAVISRDVPPDCIAFGYNQFRPRVRKQPETAGEPDQRVELLSAHPTPGR